MPQELSDRRIAVRFDDLARLVEHVEVRVDVEPGTGRSLSWDWWGARLDDLAVDYCDLGLDATLIGLTHRVRARVDELLSEDDDASRSRLLPFLLRLWLADRQGSLGSLIQASARLWGYDYEEECGFSSPTAPDSLSTVT